MSKTTLWCRLFCTCRTQNRFRLIGFALLGCVFTMHFVSELLLKFAPELAIESSRSKLTFTFYRIVNFDFEKNLPTFFNFSLLALSAGLLFLITTMVFRRNDPLRFHWILLAFTFLVLSFDEAAQMHEQLSSIVRQTVPGAGVMYFAWVIPVGIFVVLFGLGYISFLRRLPFAISATIVLGGALYVSGALGLEIVAGRLLSADPGAEMTTVWRVTMTIEETLEMSGLIVFASALIAYLRLDRALQ